MGAEGDEELDFYWDDLRRGARDVLPTRVVPSRPRRAVAHRGPGLRYGRVRRVDRGERPELAQCHHAHHNVLTVPDGVPRGAHRRFERRKDRRNRVEQP